MPTRLVRQGINDSEKVNSLLWAEEVFYRRLMGVVDDFGRIESHPTVLRAAMYSRKLDRVSETDVSSWMASCLRAGLVSCYTVLDKGYVEVCNFGQRKRFPSKCPPPIGTVDPPAERAGNNGDGPRDGPKDGPRDRQRRRRSSSRADGQAAPPSGAGGRPINSKPPVPIPPVDPFKIIAEDRRRREEYAKANGLSLAPMGTVNINDLPAKKKRAK